MRELVLISENEELYKAFKRSFKFLKGIVLNHTKATNELSFHRDDASLIFEGMSEDDFYYFRNNIRVKHRLLNPLVAFCYKSLQSFYNKNDDHHFYFHAPFKLNQVATSIKKLQPILSDQKLLEYFPTWLKDDLHTIQDLILTSDKPDEVINFVEDLIEAFNPPESIRNRGESLLNLIRDSSWQTNAYTIASNLCNLLDDIYREGIKMTGEILVIDDEIAKGSAEYRVLKAIAEDLSYVIVIRNPLKEKIEPNKNTKVAFLDIKIDPKKTGQSRLIAEQLRKQKIPYAILSGFTSSDLMKESDIKITVFNRMIDDILKTLKEEKIKISERLASPHIKANDRKGLSQFNTDIETGICLFLDYKRGLLSKSDVLKNIREEFLKTVICKNITDTFQKTEFPVIAPFPTKIYGAIRWIVKRNLQNEKESIKRMISSLSYPSDNWCTLKYDIPSKSISFSKDDTSLGTISFSGKDDLWNIVENCIASHPAPCNLKKYGDELYDYIDLTHDLVQKETDWGMLALLERTGAGTYKLKVKDIKNIELQKAHSQPESSAIVTRAEFEELQEEVNEIKKLVKEIHNNILKNQDK